MGMGMGMKEKEWGKERSYLESEDGEQRERDGAKTEELNMKRRKRLAWRDKYRNVIFWKNSRVPSKKRNPALDDFWNSMCLEGILSRDFWVTNPTNKSHGNWEISIFVVPNPVIEKSLTPNAGSSLNSGYKSLTQTHHNRIS